MARAGAVVGMDDMITHEEQTDVLVIGGGTAGAVAAIQAGRAGVKTTLVEMSAQLGGTITNGQVNFPGYFYAWGKLQVAGIGWELVTETKEMSGEKMPPVKNTELRRPGNYISINPCIFAALAEEKVIQAGVRIHYHEIVTAVERQGDRWLVQCVGRNTRRQIWTQELIDCTGDADLVGMLNLPREIGEIRQPGTMEFVLGGYDLNAFDYDQVQSAFIEALQDGRLQPGDHAWKDSQPFAQFLRVRGRNVQHIFGADSSSSASQSEANIAGRQSFLRLLRFIRSLPGGERTTVERMSAMTAVRETYRIVGESQVTYADYIKGYKYPDAICYAAFFVDVHTERGGIQEFLEPGTLPTIPFGALIPKGSRHLLVAGRCLAADRLAYAGTREQPFCMAMGQVAGAAAALAVKQGIASRDVDLSTLKAFLKENGAVVPE